jgi:hypothetical protein
VIADVVNRHTVVPENDPGLLGNSGFVGAAGRGLLYRDLDQRDRLVRGQHRTIELRRPGTAKRQRAMKLGLGPLQLLSRDGICTVKDHEAAGVSGLRVGEARHEQEKSHK